ncbi:hypothetical protein LOTGIDRAFT_171386 [Lottia gigantea]|uniref:Uncharacterized protein n=1 Tax=Lottia gigantea TaxID=225164 RepID=V4B7A9_LOTGI|nr:hypothetical protein LOTGIDRAFT_171386 [Lottia gigantea]ESP03446.1 hypothetical protein LOTGIDRAFT_171386 [Lottia gigantea]
MAGQHDNEDPIGLHDQQLKFPEYRFTEHVGEDEASRYPISVSQNRGGERILPVRALNEVFIGESLSSSYQSLHNSQTPLRGTSEQISPCIHETFGCSLQKKSKS